MCGIYEIVWEEKFHRIVCGIISRFTDKFLTEWVSTPRLITSTSSAAYRGRELSSIPPESSIITRSRRPSLFRYSDSPGNLIRTHIVKHNDICTRFCCEKGIFRCFNFNFNFFIG